MLTDRHHLCSPDTAFQGILEAMDDSAGKYCKHIPVLAHFMLRSPLLCGLSPFDHRGTAYRAYTKQPGGRKPPVPKVPWTPRIPGRNSSTDPTPQQMPRPDPLTPRLTRRRPCAALQRLITHGQLVMKICEGKIWTTSELCLEYHWISAFYQGHSRARMARTQNECGKLARLLI